MRTDPLRVVVAEDDDQLAELITSLLSDDDRFEVVGRARTGDEAVELAGDHRPDIVVMDLAIRRTTWGRWAPPWPCCPRRRGP